MDPTASSALHAPPTSYGEAAPPLKGILKNARSGSNTAPRPDDLDLPSEQPEQPTRPTQPTQPTHQPTQPAQPAQPTQPSSDAAAAPYRDSEGRLQWDEFNLASNDHWKENTAPRMKIDEPKTPFVAGAQDPDDSDIPPLEDFTLDKPAAHASSEVSVESTPSQSAHSATNAATKAELTRINTEANARLGQQQQQQQQQQQAAQREEVSNESRTSFNEHGRASRSPSFSLPDGHHAPGRRRSSAGSSAGGWDRAAATAAATTAAAAAPGPSNGISGSALSSEYEGSSDEDEEEQPPMTVEEQRKHAAFTAKRKGHYGNEAEALRVARELMAKEDEDEDEEDGSGGGLPPPPVPPVPQGYK